MTRRQLLTAVCGAMAGLLLWPWRAKAWLFPIAKPNADFKPLYLVNREKPVIETWSVRQRQEFITATTIPLPDKHLMAMRITWPSGLVDELLADPCNESDMNRVTDLFNRAQAYDGETIPPSKIRALA